jgi:hypothetical protein
MSNLIATLPMDEIGVLPTLEDSGIGSVRLCFA